MPDNLPPPASGVEARVCGWPMFAVVRDGKPLYAHPLESAARNYATGFSDAQIVEGAFAPIEARVCEWQSIETAPRDGTEIIVYCPPAHGLRHMASVCAWHEDAGFCVDELREPTLWQPLPPAERSDHE